MSIILLGLIVCAFCMDAATAGRGKALILSAASYHMEVSMFFASQLKELNYDVTFVTKAAPLFSFARAGAISKLVSKTSYITDYLPNPSLTTKNGWDVAVLITSEMDIGFLQKSKKVKELHSSLAGKPLFIVNHHAEVFEIQPTLRFCQENDLNCHIFHLSKHTHERNLMELERAHVNTTGIKFDYAYPIYDLHDLFGLDLTQKSIKYKDKDLNNLRLVMQGNVRKDRKDYGGLMNYMGDNNSSTAWCLDVLGQGARKLKVPPTVKSRVDLHDAVEYDEFYKTIMNADVLVCEFADNMHYDTVRASSSIPAAVMAGTPVLMPSKYLKAYPCLQSGVHAKWGSDAASNEAALDNLVRFSSNEDLLAAHLETKQCLEEWHKWNVKVFESVLLH